MTLEILDEVAFLFVEQFDNLYGMLRNGRFQTEIRSFERVLAQRGDDPFFILKFHPHASPDKLVFQAASEQLGG